jgi:nickel-dependent lactate racemase
VPPESPPADVLHLARGAVEGPVGSHPLGLLARGARKAVVLIPDATRAPVARRVLPEVMRSLAAGGLADAAVTVFVAGGAHAPVSEEAARALAGDAVPPTVRVVQNDSRAADDFVGVGKTARGTPINLNKVVAEADLKVAIGTVGFHYFAGMSGGRKMIVPGACNYETVRANHRLSISGEGDIHPACRSGVLEGNPVHEDMLEGLRMVAGVFMINVVIDGWGQVRDITAGDAVLSHLEAARRAKCALEVPTGPRCDMAVASAGGHPFDVDLIQSHKSIDHAAECVRDGGAVIALAECSRGVGSETFLSWFGLGGRAALVRKLLDDYQLNGQTALSLLKKLERVKIFLVSSLAREIVERTGMAPARSLAEALDAAAAFVGTKPITCVLPAAWGILPVVGEA